MGICCRVLGCAGRPCQITWPTRMGVDVLVGVSLVGVLVGVKVLVGVCVGVLVGVPVGVCVNVCVGVAVGEGWHAGIVNVSRRILNRLLVLHVNCVNREVLFPSTPTVAVVPVF